MVFANGERVKHGDDTALIKGLLKIGIARASFQRYQPGILPEISFTYVAVQLYTSPLPAKEGV